MKAINISEFDIIKCGMEFVTTTVARPGVEDLLPHMERNESYVYWMQPKGGAIEQQLACICVNGTYYSLNNKLEKAIFRNVRLTRDFQNFERLVDGTRKLVIPQRLFQEKLRTSNRVHRTPRAPLAPRCVPPALPPQKTCDSPNAISQNVSMMRKIKGRTSKTNAPAKPAADAEKPAVGAEKPAAGAEKPAAGAEKPAAGPAKPAAGAEKPAAGPAKPAAGPAKPAACAETLAVHADESLVDTPGPEPAEARRPATKRSRKSKYNLHVDCVLEGQKRRKFNFESSEVLRDYAQVLSTEEHPLIQTPRTFFRSLCDLFQQEFPNMLTQEVISAAVSTFEST
jgi:hypothetical protein